MKGVFRILVGRMNDNKRINSDKNGIIIRHKSSGIERISSIIF